MGPPPTNLGQTLVSSLAYDRVQRKADTTGITWEAAMTNLLRKLGSTKRGMALKKALNARRTIVLLGALGLGGFSIGATPAYARHEDDCRPHSERIWIEPTYRTTCDRVWVAPVYRTECQRVWREPVYRTECVRVWLPDRFDVRTRVLPRRGCE